MSNHSSSLSLSFDQALTLIRTCGSTNTVLLRGQPGIGKSALHAALAREMPDYLPCYVDCANLDLGDIAMPVVDRDAMVTRYAPSSRFGVSAGSTRPVLLMLDELGKAPKPVLNMLLPVILEHRIGDVKLPLGSVVFATTNLDTDGVQDSIPAHAYNRMTVARLSNPTSEGWLMGWAVHNDICPEIMACAREYPQMFDCYVDDPESSNPYIFNPMKGNVRSFVSPRSLAFASNLIANRDALGDALLPALAGTVGEAAARDIEAMVTLGDALPRFAAIEAAPDKAKLPEGACAHFLMAFQLAARAEASNLDKIITYIKRWDAFEAKSLWVTTLASNKAKVGMACSNREFTRMATELGKYF